MIYEEPKVDVIVFEEGEIVTDLIDASSGGGGTMNNGASAQSMNGGWSVE